MGKSAMFQGSKVNILYTGTLEADTLILDYSIDLNLILFRLIVETPEGG